MNKSPVFNLAERVIYFFAHLFAPSFAHVFVRTVQGPNIAFLLSLVLLSCAGSLSANSQDQSPPASSVLDSADYRSTPGVYGTITSVGSDTLAGLMAIWAQRFQELYPHIKFQIQATGSATASQALTQGSANIGPMSRVMNAQEIANFTRRHGYPPTALVVAIDAIALYVEKNNPVTQLTLAELDALFSITRLCGGESPINQWSQ